MKLDKHTFWKFLISALAGQLVPILIIVILSTFNSTVMSRSFWISQGVLSSILVIVAVAISWLIARRK